MILIALHKESFFHLQSKVLFRCLAIADLLVRIISKPKIALNCASLLTEYRWKELWFYSGAIAIHLVPENFLPKILMFQVAQDIINDIIKLDFSI